MVWYS